MTSHETECARWGFAMLAALKEGRLDEAEKCLCRSFKALELAREERDARMALTRRLVQAPDRPAEGAMQ